MVPDPGAITGPFAGGLRVIIFLAAAAVISAVSFRKEIKRFTGRGWCKLKLASLDWSIRLVTRYNKTACWVACSCLVVLYLAGMWYVVQEVRDFQIRAIGVAMLVILIPVSLHLVLMAISELIRRLRLIAQEALYFEIWLSRLEHERDLD